MKRDYFYGIHTAQILLTKYPESIINIYLQDSNKNTRLDELLKQAKSLGLNVTIQSKLKLDNLLGDLKHQGIIIECRGDLLFKNKTEGDLKNFYQNKLVKNQNYKFFILFLDEIQDPQNLGACIRSAEALGVDFIVTPERNSALVNNTVCKASAGAALLLPVFQVTNLARVITWLKEQGVWVYGSSMQTNRKLAELDLTGSVGLVMGAEGSGIRKLTADLCDEMFTIPMYGKTQSLNVSVATGICLYEVIRQRGL